MGQKKISKYPNPIFLEDRFDILFEKWKSAVGEETLKEEKISYRFMRESIEIVCNEFPRGNKSGELLWDPIPDNTPLEDRGVSMKWCMEAWKWMGEHCDMARRTDPTRPFVAPIIPTRLFVALFIEPLVMIQQQSSEAAAQVLPLYFFLPLQDRGKPEVFLSHGWDSWLRHLLFLTATSVPGKLAVQKSPEKVFVWLDIFAIVQDPGSTKQRSEVARIGQVVKSIGKTCLVIPGHGCLRHFALLPAKRSWCCLEIAYSGHVSARVGMNKAYFQGESGSSDNLEYHSRLIEEIRQLKCSDAETACQEEKESIQILLEEELGSLNRADHTIQQSILLAFSERYAKERKWVHAIAKLYSQALDTTTTSTPNGATYQGEHTSDRGFDSNPIIKLNSQSASSSKCTGI